MLDAPARVYGRGRPRRHHEPRIALVPRSVPALPAPLTRLIGRAAEVAAVRDVLLAPEVRLLTLVGAPGIGKTRLSLAVAHALVGSPPAGAERERGAEPGFVDGVAFVPLAPLRDPELVVPPSPRPSASGTSAADRSWRACGRPCATGGCCWCWTTASTC